MGIQTIGINPKRSKLLEKKAIELIVKSQRQVKESEIVTFLIDEMLDRVDIDHHGLYIAEELETSAEANKGKASSRVGNASSNASGKSAKTSAKAVRKD